jgi:predicted secreted protein
MGDNFGMICRSVLSRRRFIGVSSVAAPAVAVTSAAANEPQVPSPDYSIPGSGFHGKTQNKRDWQGDPRSGKVVFLSHCMLNQNARIVRAADFPAMFDPLIDYLQKEQVGAIQMPCPELYCLGLGRRAVRPGLESAAGRRRLERLIDDQIFTIKEYVFQGFKIVAILGKQGSPSCGVTETWYDDLEKSGPGQGVWIREFKKRLSAEKLDIPVFGVADHKQDEAIRWLEQRLQQL